MTGMDYNRRGGWPYGRNRLFAERQSNAVGSGARFAVLRRRGQSVLGRFDRHEEAIAERDRLQQETGDEFVVHKLW
jgi:hypothetical protein